MNFPVLRTELLTDPLVRNYSSMTDQQAANDLNSKSTGRTRNRTRVEVTEVFNAIDDGAWPSTAILQNKLGGILNMPFVDASNTNTRGIFGAIFPNSGATAATRGRLLDLATEPISRATELGLGVVTAGDVKEAREKAGGW